MVPEKPLPISNEFESTDEYVESLLHYVKTTDMFQVLCGGVHILDFFTSEPGLFQTVIPPEWQPFLKACKPMEFLDFLIRDDLASISSQKPAVKPPGSLVQYVKDIRKFTLRRSFSPKKLPALPRHVALGMNPKKIHEVTNFADFIDSLAESYATTCSQQITHFIDFGSGQNYLGRALASAPYDRRIIAVESREQNIVGAKQLDVFSGLAEKEKVLRNKKVYQQMLDSRIAPEKMNEKVLNRVAKPLVFSTEEIEAADMTPTKELESKYIPEEGKGRIYYVEGRLETGDLSEVLSKVQAEVSNRREEVVRLMAISIHSCGNLSHYGLRSMIMNPSIHAVAIVGCCYNLLTERLGPPSYKPPYMRQNMQPINRRVVQEEGKNDPQGFPLSERLSTYGGGVRLNITARMMACQAPENWTNEDSDLFFTRHFYRAVLQRLFLDKGVISKVHHDKDMTSGQTGWKETPFNMSTNPVVIGSLRKQCYTSFRAYVRGAVKKLTTASDFRQYSEIVYDKMGDITDAEIDAYEKQYAHRKVEMSSIWTLMAFSAGVTESLIVTDRWLFLEEHPDVVRDCWVETVFDYRESPRNLVVVGIKK